MRNTCAVCVSLLLIWTRMSGAQFVASVPQPVTAPSTQQQTQTSTDTSTSYTLPTRVPFTHSRDQLVEYLKRSKQTSGLSLFSQFSANVSDNEAFVVTNVVRGLTGRAMFSVDYAAVVAKAEAENPDKRKEIANDKSTLIRMVNNGGTIVGRFYAPSFATASKTSSSVGSLHLGAGLIGSLGNTETLHAAASAVAEYMSSIAIMDISGSAEQSAELLIGTRWGYSRSDAPLLQAGGARGIAFGQLAVGLRRKGDLSLSVLATKTTSQFKKLVPRLQVNFSAIR